MNEFGADGADDGAVGADDGRSMMEVQIPEDVHGKAVAAAGGDDDFDAGRFRKPESGEVSGTDVAGGVE